MNKKSTKFSESKFFFDDCPICQEMKKAEDQNRDLTLSELKMAFEKANKRKIKKL